jgi:hypothetical protein
MAQITVKPEQVIVELTPVEQLFALSRKITIPTAAIVSVEVVAEPLPAVRGIRSVAGRRERRRRWSRNGGHLDPTERGAQRGHW